MAEFNRKNKQTFMYSPLVLFVLFAILILFIYNIINLSEKERETTQKKEIALSNIENLRNREKTLTSDIDKLKTEVGVEEAIRDKYQVVKEGEKMVVIVNNDDKLEISQTDIKQVHGFWGWIKRTFKL